MRLKACLGLLLLAGADIVAPALAQTASAVPGIGVYRLNSGDKLKIQVYGEENLSGEQVIGPDGSITLPLVGRVPAKGRTVADITEEVRTKLADGFVQNPSVAITIAAYRPFYILGEVNTPGQYEYAQGMTLLAAVARAGGYTYRAKKSEVWVKHEDSPEEERVQVTTGLLIQPGDTIRVGERYF